MKNVKSYPKVSKKAAPVECDDVQCVEELKSLDALSERLDYVGRYARDLTNRTGRVVNRVFAEPRDDEDSGVDGDPVHIGSVERLNLQINYILEVLDELQSEIATIERL